MKRFNLVKRIGYVLVFLPVLLSAGWAQTEAANERR